MNRAEVIEKIRLYLSKSPKEDGTFRPKFINVMNVEDMEAIKAYFAGHKRWLLPASSLCKRDYLPQSEHVFETLIRREDSTLLTEWTTFLMFEGREKRADALKHCMQMTFKYPAVVLCYHCETLLKQLITRDMRRESQVMFIEAKPSELPAVKAIRPEMAGEMVHELCSDLILDGIENTAAEIESMDSIECRDCIENEDGVKSEERYTICRTLIVKTHYGRESLSRSLIEIDSIGTPLQMISELDASALMLNEEMGDDFEWMYLLELVQKKGTIRDAILGTLEIDSLNETAGYVTWNQNQRWLYFIGLKLRGCNNGYLTEVVNKALSAGEFERCVYRVIADTPWHNEEFARKYRQRKRLLNSMGNPERECNDFCKWIMQKEANALYYLTDNTTAERKTCLRLLSLYGSKDTYRNRLRAVEFVWPELAEYLGEIHLPVPKGYAGVDLDRYFFDYRYQKVFNRVDETFEETVRQAAESKDIFRFAKRGRDVEAVCRNAKTSEVWFVDALGIEFMAYIDALCRKRGLNYKLSIHRAELPTLTACNKDFWELFKAAGVRCYDVKGIDEQKHHKVTDEDYVKSPLPYHLIAELDELKKVISRIEETLNYSGVEKAYIISDHGATRLAVISPHVREIDAPGKGSHGGRICSGSENSERIPGAIRTDSGDYVLANYNRFRGARAPEVEVHGGASIEEVLVPFIEFTKPGIVAQYEFTLKDDKPIPVSIRDCAVVRVFSKTSFDALSLRLNGGRYQGCEFDGASSDGQNFEFECACITKPGTYAFDIYHGDKCVKKDLSFKTVNKGMVSNDDDW